MHPPTFDFYTIRGDIVAVTEPTDPAYTTFVGIRSLLPARSAAG
jgi:hypothetical protein